MKQQHSNKIEMTLLLCRAPLCVRHKTEPFVFSYIFSFSFPLPRFYWINFTHLRWWCWNWMSKAALRRLPLAENPICIDACVCSSGTPPDKAPVWDIVRVLLVQMIAAYRCADSVSKRSGIKFSTKLAARAVENDWWNCSTIDEYRTSYLMNWKHLILSWVSFKRSATGHYKHLWGLLCVSSVVVEQDDSVGP